MHYQLLLYYITTQKEAHMHMRCLGNYSVIIAQQFPPTNLQLLKNAIASPHNLSDMVCNYGLEDKQ